MGSSAPDRSNVQVLEGFFEGGLDSLLEDKEVSDYLKAGLKEAGCPPPFHIILVALFRKVAVLGWEFAGQTLRSRLLELLARNARLCRFLDRLANVCRTCEDRNRLKDMMIAHLRGEVRDLPPPKIDDATDAQVLAQLYTKQRFDDQDAQLAAIAEGLQDVLTEKSGDAIALYLGWAEGSDGTIADSIRYNSGLYDFEGREDEIDLLHHFAGDVSGASASSRFSWLLLVGRGGEGKTRLALEYTTKRIGVNWYAGRLSLPDLKQFRHGDWLPTQPTMIVIDYPGQGPGPVHALLANFARRHRAFDWPVRVLLLEREARGRWFEQVFPQSGDGAAIRAHAFVHQGEPLLEGRLVQPLPPEAIASMMTSRFKRAGLEPPDPNLLLAAAAQVDRRTAASTLELAAPPRPLFAAAVAEVMAGALERGDDVSAGWVEALDREDVLAEIVRRDRDMHWLPSAGGDHDALVRHENLLALATLAGGVRRSDLRDVPAPVAHLLPHPGEVGEGCLREDLVRRMSGYEQGHIAPLEPDLLGEYFVLSRLRRIDEVEGGPVREGICELAYHVGGMNAAGSTLRTVLDFPERSETLDWLLPGRNSSLPVLEKASGLVIDLIGHLGLRCTPALDWVREAREGAARGEQIALHEAMAVVNALHHAGSENDWTTIDAMLARIDALRAAFPDHLEVAEQESAAAFNITTDAARLNEWRRTDDMLARIDRLRASYPANAEIALNEAMAAYNYMNRARKAGDRARGSAMMARLDDLREAFPDHFEIALRMTKSAVNETGTDASLDDWPRLESMLSRISGLRSAFPDRLELVGQEAMAAANIAGHAAQAGKSALVDSIFARLDQLRLDFPTDVEVVTQEGKAVVNASAAAAEAEEWEKVDSLLARIDRLRALYPEQPDLIMYEAMTAANIVRPATLAGDFARVDAMLVRGRTLAATPVAAASGPLLALWITKLLGRIHAEEEIEGGLIDELLERLQVAVAAVGAANDSEIAASLTLVKHLTVSGHGARTGELVRMLTSAGVDWSVVPDLNVMDIPTALGFKPG